MKKIGYALLGVMMPAVTFATAPADDPGRVNPITFSGSITADNFVDFVALLVGWLLAIAGILAILFIILGGVLYIVSAGNEKRTETAKKMILYACIGLGVILLAYVIYWLVTGTLGSIFV